MQIIAKIVKCCQKATDHRWRNLCYVRLQTAGMQNSKSQAMLTPFTVYFKSSRAKLNTKLKLNFALNFTPQEKYLNQKNKIFLQESHKYGPGPRYQH